MDNETLFDNGRYYVQTRIMPVELAVTAHGAKHVHVYAVTNKETGVDEVLTPSYPDAVAAAEQLDIAVENAVWKWMRIQADAEDMAKAEEAGSTDPELH